MRRGYCPVRALRLRGQGCARVHMPSAGALWKPTDSTCEESRHRSRSRRLSEKNKSQLADRSSSSARSRRAGSHARSAGDLHRWGHSPPSSTRESARAGTPRRWARWSDRPVLGQWAPAHWPAGWAAAPSMEVTRAPRVTAGAARACAAVTAGTPPLRDRTARDPYCAPHLCRSAAETCIVLLPNL